MTRRFLLLHHNQAKGFTLIELLVVIAIIGVLSALLMSNFVGIRERARDGQRKSDLRQIQAALELYRADNGSYPLTDDFPVCGDAFSETVGGNTTTYMKKIPCDPIKDDPYEYQYGGTSTNYCLRTCLENENDPQITTGSGSCSSLVTACPTAIDYTVENP